jgi:cholesterol oxidase
VVLAAESIGTTELLLRCSDQYRTLPKVSQRLGKGWSPNANFLTPDRFPDGDRVRQGIGPTISAGLEFMDGSVNGQRFFVEDDGFPNILYGALSTGPGSLALRRLAGLPGRHRKRGLDEANLARNVMVWLGEGIDAADGELRLKRRLLAPWKKDIRLDWRVDASRDVADAILEMHKRLSKAAGGKLYVPLYWRLLRGMLSVHPLGGCAMGASAADGVVDHRGAVFGYENLFVSDGAIVPTAVGRNPSMTIGALGERVADLMMHTTSGVAFGGNEATESVPAELGD